MMCCQPRRTDFLSMRSHQTLAAPPSPCRWSICQESLCWRNQCAPQPSRRSAWYPCSPCFYWAVQTQMEQLPLVLYCWTAKRAELHSSQLYCSFWPESSQVLCPLRQLANQEQCQLSEYLQLHSFQPACPMHRAPHCSCAPAKGSVCHRNQTAWLWVCHLLQPLRSIVQCLRAMRCFLLAVRWLQAHCVWVQRHPWMERWITLKK